MSKRGGVYALGKGGEEGTRLEIWMSNVSGDWGWKRKTHRKRRALWALFGKTRSAQRTGGILQIKILGNMRLLLLSAQIALHDAGGELVAAGVEGHALGQTCQLIDEAHPFHPPIVFDQRERADAAPFADCQYRLLERRDRAALIGRIEEVDEVDRILREARVDKRLHRHWHALGGEEAAIPHHRAGHVEQDHGREVGHPLVEVKLEVLFSEFDRVQGSLFRIQGGRRICLS